jgi:DNA-binding transcriptional regulator PaaX
MYETDWLLFIAQLPATPSSLRVRVWRKLRGAGATSLQNGVWILPRTEENTRFMERLLGTVRQNEASAQVFTVQGLNQAVQENILARFQADRDQEYAEYLEQSQAFLDELDKETGEQKFTFAELEENEHNLQRLRKWLAKIQKRDFLQAGKSQQARAAFQECRQRLQIYTRQVYQREGIDMAQGAEVTSEEHGLPEEETGDEHEDQA